MTHHQNISFKTDYSRFQEGAKRLKDAMSGIPDRTPVYAQMHEFAMHELGIPAKTFYTTPEILTPGSLEIAERLGLDAGFVDYDVYNIEAEGLGQKIVYFEKEIPDVDRATPLITGPENLNKIRTPDFDSTGRFSTIVEMQSIYEKLTGLPPALQFCAPFSTGYANKPRLRQRNFRCSRRRSSSSLDYLPEEALPQCSQYCWS